MVVTTWTDYFHSKLLMDSWYGTLHRQTVTCRQFTSLANAYVPVDPDTVDDDDGSRPVQDLSHLRTKPFTHVGVLALLIIVVLLQVNVLQPTPQPPKLAAAQERR